VDLVALLQENVGAMCARVHHKVQKDSHNVGHLPKESKCTYKVFERSTPPSV